MQFPRDVPDIHLEAVTRLWPHTDSLFLVNQQAEKNIRDFRLAFFNRVLNILIVFVAQTKEDVPSYEIGVPIRNCVQATRDQIGKLLASTHPFTDRRLQ